MIFLNLSVFDVDKTIFTVNSSFKYYFFLVKKKVFPKRSFFKLLKIFFNFNFSPENLHKKVFFSFLKGKKEKDIFKYVDSFLEDILFYFLNEKVFSFLKLSKKRGDKILLISNSPELLIEKIAKKLFIENYAATSYKNDKLGRLNDINYMMTGENKAEYVLKLANNLNISKDNIFLFTDSMWDYPLLKISGNIYVVNPNKRLKKIAEKNRWNIL